MGTPRELRCAITLWPEIIADCERTQINPIQINEVRSEDPQMPLDPVVTEYLASLHALAGPTPRVDAIPALRAQVDIMMASAAAVDESVTIEDRTVRDIPVRLYRPT